MQFNAHKLFKFINVYPYTGITSVEVSGNALLWTAVLNKCM